MIPEDVKDAIDRMSTPLDDSWINSKSATVQAVINCMRLIATHIAAQDAEIERLRIALADGVDMATRLIDERDALWARIEDAATGFVVQIGDDEEGQPRAIVHSTRDDLMRGPSIACKHVALVVVG